MSIKTLATSVITSLAIGSTSLLANPGFHPAKVVIIKADDYSGNWNSQQQKWTDFVTASRNLGIKVSLGVVPSRIPANNDAAQWMQQQLALGDVGFWNHGWDHSRDPADPPTFWEFRNTPLADQQEHFADAQAWLLAATGQAPAAFGAPYNQTDANTMTVMNATPATRLFFTYNGGTARTQGLVKRVHTIGIIAESGGTGKPVAATFISTYPDGPAGPVSLQFHPAAFTAADLAEYVQIIEFLQSNGYTFMLPDEYVAAAVPEGAKVWTGATDANWTSTTNWSPTGAPASGADVAFDGSGANLNTITGAAFTLNSITLTSSQTAQVTLNTVAGSADPAVAAQNITLNPGAPLTVATGSHRLVGTGTGTSAGFRDLVFTGSAGTDSYTLHIGGTASFEIQGRIGAAGTGFGARTYTKTGTGTLILSGNSGGGSAWQHGDFAIQQGTLRLAQTNAAGNSANHYTVTAGAALELDGSFNQTLNNGNYTFNGTGIGGNGALRSISGTKSIAGTGTGGINLATNASIGVDAGILTIAQIIKGPGSLTKVGSGTLTLTGANTYSGATVVSAGTLALGASEVLSNGQVTLGAATLTIAAGFAETTGRLNATGAATLNLGTGSTIAFAATGDLLDWAGTLNITGDFLPNVSVRFGTTAAGLTAAQLAKITVNGTGGYSLNASGYLGLPVASTDYTYVDANPTNTTLNGAPLVDRNTNGSSGNYFNQFNSPNAIGTGTDGFWTLRNTAGFENNNYFESDSVNVTGDAENTPPLVTTINLPTPGTYDIVVLFSRNSNRDIAAKIGSAPTSADIFTTVNALNADQNLTPEPQIVFDNTYTNSRGGNTGAGYLGQVTTTTAGETVSIYVNGFDSLAGTQDERTQYEGVGYRPANANPPPEPKHYDVYLIAGQSNADGRGTNSELTGPLASYAGQQAGVKIFYVNPINDDPVNPTWNTGWRTLEPGYSVVGTVSSLPSTRFGFEVSLGKALAAKDPSRNIAIIKVTRGGTNLHTQWDPNLATTDNFMWRTFANKVPEAMAALTANGDTAEIHGMFWHQGESDGSNPTYQADLAEFIAACRTLTAKPNLPFAIGELEREPGGSTRATQLTAMANVASADPNSFVVSSAGLATYDGTHFTSAAYITFGERFAKAYHDFVDGVTFSVTYDGNGSTGGMLPVDPKNPYSSVSTATVLGAGNLTKSGHNFAGWNTAAIGNGTAYAAGNVFAITENTTLHAQWTPKPAPTITTLPSAAPITEGQPLSTSSLDGGSASVPGTFAFTNPAIIPPAGTYAADVTFTPTDTATYNTTQSTVNVTVRTLFEAWANDEAITFAGDTNGDGITDGIAWLLGAAGPATNATSLLPSATANSGALEASFRMRNQASRGAAVLELQYGTTLGAWTTVTIPEESGTQDGVDFFITPNGELSAVVVTIPASSAPDGRLFIRLSGSEN